jgi:Ca-activated chloride channel family protein
VRVELRPGVARAITDRSGEYAFSVPAKRVSGTEVTLSATKLGFKAVEKTVRVGGDSVRVDFALHTEAVSLEGLVVTGIGQAAERREAESAATTLRDMAAPAASANLAAGHPDLPPDWNTESYDRIYDNQFLAVSTNPLSTFAIDVDRASYSNVRRFITQGQLPPKDAVRIEELINYFPYDYAEPRGEHPFAVTTEVAAAPWQPQHRLVRIGLQAKRIDTRNLPPANLVFLLDVSGSMQSADKLPLLKSSLRLLVDELRPQDRVAIVVYAGAAGLVLPPTAGSDKETILDAIERLEAGGSTAGGAGIRLAYDVAQRNFRRGANNRVILATDGDFNIGASSDAEMTRLIEEKREGGVFLTVLGFGTGNLKDSKMEALADHGNGNYAYIDGLMEAKKTLVHELGGTLLTVAKDVKLQLEFNPARVRAYRLIGYENRLLRDEDFNDDHKDAGEMGAGHSVTALYEIIPAGVRSPVRVGDVDTLRYQRPRGRNGIAGEDELLHVKLRYKQPDGERSRLFSQAVHDGAARPSADFAFATAVAEFGMLLRDSEFKGSSSLEHVLEMARRSRGDDPLGYRAEFVRLAEAVRALGLPDDGVTRGR